MDKYITVIWFVMLACLTSLKAQSSKTPVQFLNQHIEAEGIDSLVFDVDGEIFFRKTTGSQLLIEIGIEVDRSTPNIMAVLTRTSRYKLIPTRNNNILTLAANRDVPVIKIGDMIAEEKITYKVYLPPALWKMDKKH